MMPKTIDIKGPIITNDDKWIYDWFGVASCCPADIRSQLDEVANDEGVQVVINSSGGDIFAASEIYDMLAESKATIKVILLPLPLHTSLVRAHLKLCQQVCL